MPTWHRGATPSLSFMYPTFGATPTPHMPTSTTVRGLEDMLSSSLGQHIVSYELPRGFIIPSFAMYDGSSNPYDHMLHFNQAMILNAGDDRLLCKVFPASLNGPALAWFHKLPRRSINSFSELWAIFVSQCLCSVRQKGNISSLQTIFKREDESIRDFTRRFRGAVQQLDRTVWMWSSIISEGALGRLPHSSTRYLWIRLRQRKNCKDGRINIQHCRTISEQHLKP